MTALTINNHKFTIHAFNSEIKPDWDILCPVCMAIEWRKGEGLNTTGILGCFGAWTEVEEWNYMVFCSVNCKALFEINPLVYENERQV